MKRILLITRQAPYGSNDAREGIELAIAAALFDQEISVLFSDDAVFQLLKNQHPTGLDQKNTGSMIESFPLYDIEKAYVSKRALSERGLDQSNLVSTASVLNAQQIKDLISQQDHVFNV